jgi:ribonuclease E
MAKEICISTTPHETRLAIIEDDQLAEIYYERENEYTLAGSIYKGRVTRVLPGMQSSFVDVGLERDAFLYVTDFLEEQEDSEEYETTSGGRQKQERSQQPEEPATAPASGEERRGKRDGRRGRGDRTAERPVEVAAEPVAAAPRRNQAAEERAAASAALSAAQPQPSDRDEKGDEESPEGTRRWRGRRGRRRGGMRAGVLGASTGSPSEPQASEAVADKEPFATPERGAPGGFAPPQNVSFEPTNSAEEAPETFEIRASASPARTSESRRESKSRSASRGTDMQGTSSLSTGARVPANVLPGESMSKYGVKAATGETLTKPEPKATVPGKSVNYIAPKPSTLVEVGTDWDGGMVLPGESLSRYKGSPAGGSPAVSAAAATPELNKEVAPEHETKNPAEQEQHEAAVMAAIHAVALQAVQPETVAEAIPGSEHPERQVTTADAGDPSLHTARAIDASASETQLPAAGLSEEYEPQEGAAAEHPTPPQTSELRFSQLFGGGGESKAAAEASRDQPVSDGEQVDAGRSTTQAGGERTGNSELLTFADVYAKTLNPTDHAIESELREDFAYDRDDKLDERDARLSAEAREPDESASHRSFTQLVDQLQGFSPGSGLLEEEVIDEDEYDFDPIHAHSDEHDLEELEEETLDGDGHEETDTEEAAHTRELTRFDGEEDEVRKAAPAAFALEEIDDIEVGFEEEEDEAAPSAEGAPQRAGSGKERGRRDGRNVRRRGAGSAGGRRSSAQAQDLPIISDLLKQGQEILVQIAKEPIAKKGARITSHIALPGRFLVFMPTVNHVGVSRKIEADEERQRLKRILISERGDAGGGFIVRTAAEGASEEELRADLRFLISLWTEIKQRSETAKAPSLLYHDLNLVERILRDQVSSNFSTIWVDTEQEYERIVRFLNRFQPSLVRRVKLYTKETPLFEHFGITEEISKALKSKVWLKSGGSIVINQTEALVAIDINTGKYVGKTARLEDTIVKTNLDAIPEIVRQIRLRDLGGIIVIDFIDMDERKNRHKVLAALEEAMKADRAPSKVLQFNDFGLVAITRKRVKQSLERTLSVQCETCAGTGMVKSPTTVCNEIYIELRKMQKHLDGKDVMLRVNPEVVKQLKSSNGRWITEYEEMVGKTIIIKSDPALHPEQFDIH